MELFAKVSHGYLYITTNGGNGNEGQPGANGRKGTDDDTTVCESENSDIVNKITLYLYLYHYMYL